MTISNSVVDVIPTLTWEDFHKINYSFASPFYVRLITGDVLYVQRILRLIPKRRLVGLATWQGKLVIAKLFFDSHAKRHLKKDAEGVKRLQEHKIPTPALYYQGSNEGHKISVLLFEYIADAENFAEVWRNQSTVEALLPLLQTMLVELATQHVLGVQQHDLHLGNFLLTEKHIYTLDGASIQSSAFLLPKKASMENLALFVSQLGVGAEDYHEQLFCYYAKCRGWLIKPEDMMAFSLLVKKWHEYRWRKFQKKIKRASTHFLPLKNWWSKGMVDRHYAFPEMMNFLAHPDQIFHQPHVQLLKAGRSATVIKVILDGREFVVKRYNSKNIWHFLRRCFRPTRAFTSWRCAQKLNLFGVATATPVAFIEKRWLGLRGASYYVTPYIAGEHVGHFFMRHCGDEEKVATMIHKIKTLFKNIAKLEMTHGDLKMTNILIDETHKPILIDLDGMIEHLSISGLHQTWRKEIKRFLENFHDQPSIRERFKQVL